jgi:hypothetical protein
MLPFPDHPLCQMSMHRHLLIRFRVVFVVDTDVLF